MTGMAGTVEIDNVTDRLVWRRAAVSMSLALVFLAAVAAFFLAQTVDRQVQDVVRTYDLRKTARELTIALVDAESGQRGYLLTGDEEYLQPYDDTVKTVGQRIQALEQMTQDNPEQASRLTVITTAIDKKLSEMATTIALARDRQGEVAASIVKGGEGVRLMAGLRDSLNTFISEEDQRLLDRNRSITQSRLWLIISILVALAAAVVLTFVLFNRTQRQVSALSRSQGELSGQRDLLAQKVRERTAELEASEAHALNERQRVETLLKETNHRIGNSLATVSSLLGLQLMRSRSEEVKEALDAARQRVHAIASAHRRLRLGDDLETTDADEFLSSVLDDLKKTYAGTDAIEFSQLLEPIAINSRDATTLGILVGELVTNSLKHAFSFGQRGHIEVKLFREPEHGVATLQVTDDGRGPNDEASLCEGGLGSVIVRQLAQQFGGKPIYCKGPEGGLRVIVPVPKIEQNAHKSYATV